MIHANCEVPSILEPNLRTDIDDIFFPTFNLFQHNTNHKSRFIVHFINAVGFKLLVPHSQSRFQDKHNSLCVCVSACVYIHYMLHAVHPAAIID